MAQISHLVRIRAALEQAYGRVVTTAGIGEWLTQASSSNYRKGGTLELLFPDQRVQFVTAELIAPSRIVWRCTTKDSDWFDTDIAFEFVARADLTLVRFGWPEVADLFRDCSMSWAYFLESLRSLVEEGRGTPENSIGE